jgi:hypothetical protein
MTEKRTLDLLPRFFAPAKAIRFGEVRIEIGVLVHFRELVDDLVVRPKHGSDSRQEPPRGQVEPDPFVFPPRIGVEDIPSSAIDRAI